MYASAASLVEKVLKTGDGWSWYKRCTQSACPVRDDSRSETGRSSSIPSLHLAIMSPLCPRVMPLLSRPTPGRAPGRPIGRRVTSSSSDTSGAKDGARNHCFRSTHDDLPFRLRPASVHPLLMAPSHADKEIPLLATRSRRGAGTVRPARGPRSGVVARVDGRGWWQPRDPPRRLWLYRPFGGDAR